MQNAKNTVFLCVFRMLSVPMRMGTDVGTNWPLPFANLVDPVDQ